ncbi:hypothetical protein [Nocardioides conyzicola]|uniref:Carboxypeptidase regulatory-like domain-containing protein n=1 Tax=Nocardioides conyzicola TaxID=1651781 RepID=A0ABP8X9Y1_9ACTN
MPLHRIALCGVALASLVLTTGLNAPAGSAAPPDRERGGPGSWTKISVGGSGITYTSSLHRTADGVLHVIYPKGSGAADQLGHVSISPSGAVIQQNDALPSAWAAMDLTPALVGTADGGLRAVFGGIQSVDPGFWSDGRMYTATAPASGASWTLPAEAVGTTTSAVDSYGTGATTLADGTPVAAWPLNSRITWHVGTGSDPDQSFDLPYCCAYDVSVVRDGDDVWLGWYGNGSTAATNGIFVRKIYPTAGAIIKAPQSSVGANSPRLGQVALAARTGGGVYAAYCVGYPTCDHIGLWKVGTSKVTKVPHSKYVDHLAISPGPSGRLWIAWSDNIPKIQTIRTGRNGSGMGAGQRLGMPHGTDSVYDVAIDGTTGRGDVVIQVGNGFWHTQAFAGLTLTGKPGAWKHGKKRKVTFAVTDAGDAVAGAKVKAGSRTCTTKGNGKCTITFPKATKKGKVTVRATRNAYGPAVLVLKVK